MGHTLLLGACWDLSLITGVRNREGSAGREVVRRISIVLHDSSFRGSCYYFLRHCSINPLKLRYRGTYHWGQGGGEPKR